MNNKTEKIIISLFTILILTTLLSVSSLAYTITTVNGIEVSDVHNKKITFQSWSGFTKETRWAIDYASRQWNNKSGKTILYHSPTQHNNNIFYSRDYQNLITKKSFYYFCSCLDSCYTMLVFVFCLWRKWCDSSFKLWPTSISLFKTSRLEG